MTSHHAHRPDEALRKELTNKVYQHLGHQQAAQVFDPAGLFSGALLAAASTNVQVHTSADAPMPNGSADAAIVWLPKQTEWRDLPDVVRQAWDTLKRGGVLICARDTSAGTAFFVTNLQSLAEHPDVHAWTAGQGITGYLSTKEDLSWRNNPVDVNGTRFPSWYAMKIWLSTVNDPARCRALGAVAAAPEKILESHLTHTLLEHALLTMPQVYWTRTICCAEQAFYLKMFKEAFQ